MKKCLSSSAACVSVSESFEFVVSVAFNNKAALFSDE